MKRCPPRWELCKKVRRGYHVAPKHGPARNDDRYGDSVCLERLCVALGTAASLRTAQPPRAPSTRSQRARRARLVHGEVVCLLGLLAWALSHPSLTPSNEGPEPPVLFARAGGTTVVVPWRVVGRLRSALGHEAEPLARALREMATRAETSLWELTDEDVQLLRELRDAFVAIRRS